MNREILFRGKRIDNGEWVYGYLWSSRTIGCESPCGNIDEIVVGPSTVGQYTGESDMHGTRAYEGDVIVPGGYKPDSVTGIIRFSSNRPDTSGQNRKEIGFWVEWQGDYSQQLRDDLGYWLPKSRVIGNIHDGKDEQHD